MLNFRGVHDVHDIALDSLIDCPCDLTCKLSFAEAKANGTHPQSNMPHQSYRSQKASTLETRAIKTRTIKWKTQGANPKHLSLATHMSPTRCRWPIVRVVISQCPCWVPDVGWITSGTLKLNNIPCTLYHVPSTPMCPHPYPTKALRSDFPWLAGMWFHDTIGSWWRTQCKDVMGFNDAMDLLLKWSNHWWQSTVDSTQECHRM